MEAVLRMFAGFGDIANGADFLSVDAVHDEVARVLVAKVKLVRKDLGKDDGARHVGRGFFLREISQAERRATLPIASAPALEIRAGERLEKQSAEKEVFQSWGA